MLCKINKGFAEGLTNSNASFIMGNLVNKSLTSKNSSNSGKNFRKIKWFNYIIWFHLIFKHEQIVAPDVFALRSKMEVNLVVSDSLC